jgi:hypothetical protein
MQNPVIAADHYNPPPKIASLQALTRLRPPRGQEWQVFAFVLNRDMIKEDGTLDDLYALLFPLGSFGESEEAFKHARKTIEITGHNAVIAGPYGSAIKLSSAFDPDHLEEVVLNEKGKLVEFEQAEYDHMKEEYERRTKIEREVAEEAEKETDPDELEHFKRQAYLAIKNLSKWKHLQRETETAQKNFEKRRDLVRDHYRRHPEHEAQWLPYLKDKLIERGENALYQSLEAAYQEIREDLLGLVEEKEKTIEENKIKEMVSPSKHEKQVKTSITVIPTPPQLPGKKGKK